MLKGIFYRFGRPGQDTPERKFMLLLSALHQRNFGQLRLSKGISPLGLHRPYEIASATSFNSDGATVKHELYACGAAGSSDGELSLFE